MRKSITQNCVYPHETDEQILIFIFYFFHFSDTRLRFG